MGFDYFWTRQFTYVLQNHQIQNSFTISSLQKEIIFIYK